MSKVARLVSHQAIPLGVPPRKMESCFGAWWHPSGAPEINKFEMIKHALTHLSCNLLAFCLLSLTAVPSQAQISEKPSLTVSAAASLKQVLTAIHASYGAATVTVNFGSSGALQQQIVHGAPVDVFIAAAQKNMDELEAQRLVVSASRKNVAANRLVLVVPQGDRKISSFRDLAQPIIKRFAMGEPGSVPAGKYATEVLANLKIYDRVIGKAIFAKDVRAVLAQVELGNVDAGLVYASDAHTAKNVRVVATAPVRLHQPILYPAAIVADSKQKEAAQAYLRFLGGPNARKLFKQYGFTAVK